GQSELPEEIDCFKEFGLRFSQLFGIGIVMEVECYAVRRNKLLVFSFEISRKDVSHTQPLASHLILVGRSYPSEGRTYLGVAFRLFVGGIQQPVGRDDKRSLFGYGEVAFEIEIIGLEC